ncbi:hypothetical protein AAIP97_000178 [Klebsiella pneumoniae]|uniref:hypothetical protein n=1 Tax=Klebsiella TaxID=570 RepID=UPI00069E5455|nr:hypothetical protein [Klebsiella pneumoniae]AMV51546.1 hypothetical protein AOD72_11710 [Klebsiella pneumoniae subsp. pneumoniae]AMV56682.1 hypothetical protein AOG31_11305 [Klebsiella pneumoniae subsp. pneumoniae]AUJ40708.1 hypothetical protein BVU42_15580 [Klebsiella pneumoniae]AUJ45978.1 hypothetical protein BV506_15760 [Klebsiella pneumoniae]EIV5316109.1 hypothetical protein [Klebsiella pneumoniae]
MKKKFDASILPSVSNAADISRYDKAARPPIVLTDMGSLMFAGKTDTDEKVILFITIMVMFSILFLRAVTACL